MAGTRTCHRTVGPSPVPPPDLNTREPYMTLCGPLANPNFYTYCSHPKPVIRPKYRNDIPKPRGVHDYFNVMWDPHVYRGNAFVPFDQAEEDRCLAAKKKKRTDIKNQARKVGGVLIPSTPPPDGKNNQVVQTDRFLEELIGSVEEIDACTQTDAIHEQPIPESYIPAKFGLDVATQIEPCDLFDFNREVCPIVENMVNKILEQSLLEVMEEEELQALRDQQRAYEELRRQELIRLKRLAERERKIQEEQHRLMEKMQDERLCEVETEGRIGSYLFASNYLKDMVNNSLECLRRDGYLQNKAELFSELVPWLNTAVSVEVKSADVSRLLLDDIIRSVANQRAKEMSYADYVPESQGEGVTQDVVPEDEEYF